MASSMSPYYWAFRCCKSPINFDIVLISDILRPYDLGIRAFYLRSIISASTHWFISITNKTTSSMLLNNPFIKKVLKVKRH
jgi:hypothetical protein